MQISHREIGLLKVKMKFAPLCPTLCDPMDYTVHGILQARILEWVAFPFSRGSSRPRDQTQVSLIAGGFFTSWATGKPKNTGKSTGEGIGYPEAQAFLCFPFGSAGKESAGDLGSVLGLGSSTGEGKGYLLQYSGRENSMVCSPCGHKESDATEQLSLSLSFGWGQ